MRAMWDAQPKDINYQHHGKTYKNDNHGGNQNMKYNGDFHTLLGKIKQVKENVQKALWQQRTTNEKRKICDETQEEYENEGANGNFNLEHNLVCEIDQLSISEDDENCQ
jgi:hypothetical protein